MIAYWLAVRAGVRIIIAAPAAEGQLLTRHKNIDILAQTPQQLEQHPSATRAIDLAHKLIYVRAAVGAPVLATIPSEFDFVKVNGTNRYYVLVDSSWAPVKLSYLHDYGSR